MKQKDEYKPIGSDTVNVYGFKFGRYRYQVEHFNHNKEPENTDPNKITCREYWNTLYGTRVYRFLDWEFDYHIDSTIFFDTYIEKDELKEMILNDAIDWKTEDPYDFKDRFFTDKNDRMFSALFWAEKEPIKLPYPECDEPYEKCPHCGGELDESVLEIEYCEDVFNSKGGYSYEGDYSASWDEVHRCPHCNHLFYVHEEC